MNIFAIQDASDRRLGDYIVYNGKLNQYVPSESFPEGYMCPPATLTHSEANELVVKLKRETGIDYYVKLAPRPCPKCGREIWTDDLDFAHPTNREMSEWRAGCNKHDFGCGFEIIGASYDDVIHTWNHIPR